MRAIEYKNGLYGFVHEAGEVWCNDDWPTAFVLRLRLQWEWGWVPPEHLQEVEAALREKPWPDWAALVVELFARGMDWPEAWDATKRLIERR